jgi:hypothetical protein
MSGRASQSAGHPRGGRSSAGTSSSQEQAPAPDVAPVPDTPPARTVSLDTLVLCAFAWLAAHELVASPYGPNFYRDLVRPEVWPKVPEWLRLPPPGTALVEDPLNRLLAAVAVGASLLYAAADLMLGRGRARRALKMLGLGTAVCAVVLIPAALEMALGEWHGRPWHGHDGGVLQTEQATDHVLSGTNPYAVDYVDTPQGQQSARSAFWRRMGGNPALYHLPYLPGCFLLPIPLRPVARAVFGFYDPRMLYLLCYAGTLAAAAALRSRHRPALIAAVALCPLLVPYVVEGRNEVLVLFPMAAMALCLQRRRLRTALVLYGLACSIKQFAWLYAPLVAAYLLGPLPLTRARLGRALGLGAWAALPFLLLVGPFLLWDARSFWADTVAFMGGGTTEHPYPFSGTPGLGLANVLLYAGAVESLRAPYGFGAWQLMLAGPLLLAAAAALLRRPDWRLLLGAGTVLCGLFVYASRVLHVNYLGLLFPLLAIAAAAEDEEKEST